MTANNTDLQNRLAKSKNWHKFDNNLKFIRALAYYTNENETLPTFTDMAEITGLTKLQTSAAEDTNYDLGLINTKWFKKYVDGKGIWSHGYVMCMEAQAVVRDIIPLNKLEKIYDNLKKSDLLGGDYP